MSENKMQRFTSNSLPTSCLSVVPSSSDVCWRNYPNAAKRSKHFRKENGARRFLKYHQNINPREKFLQNIDKMTVLL